MADTDDASPKGRLTASLNRGKKDGDKQPLFKGTVQIEGEPFAREAAIWAHKSRQGAVYLTGETREAAASQIARMVDGGELFADYAADKQVMDRELPAGALILFTNAEKKSARAHDYWGYYNPGADHPLMAMRIWASHDAELNPKLSGNFSVYQPSPALEVIEEQVEAPVQGKRRRQRM